LEHNSKSFPAPKLSNASHTQHNGKPSNQSNSSDDVKITNNNNTTIASSISPAINSSGDKHTGLGHRYHNPAYERDSGIAHLFLDSVP
jgi:hypothetical protein